LNLPKEIVILLHKDLSCDLLTDCITHRLLDCSERTFCY